MAGTQRKRHTYVKMENQMSQSSPALLTTMKSCRRKKDRTGQNSAWLDSTQLGMAAALGNLRQHLEKVASHAHGRHLAAGASALYD